MTHDWTGAALVIAACIIICQAAALHTAWTKRDHWAMRAIKAEGDNLILNAHNADLRRQRDHAKSLSTVVPMFRGGLDEKAETYPDSWVAS